MSFDLETLERRLRAARIVPVVRVEDASQAHDLCGRLLEARLDLIELTTTIAGWPGVVATLRRDSPELGLGVGTITSAEQARTAIEAGADFCVSPRLAPDARAVLDAAGVPFVEGGLTPTEVLGAAAHGIAKLFPAHVGGVKYLSTLLAVSPGARIVPTGGIGLGDVGDWLAAGAIAVGVGSDLTAPGDITARVQEALRT